ncbi:MAG: hypothetical protein KIS92_02805 [Planctomycetota bacterium]|nr:hypothetical protein [Planctomycetota bacterium]
MRSYRPFACAAVILVASLASLSTLRAEDGVPDASFDKRGDLEGVTGRQWVEYKDFHFLVVPPRSLLLKDPRNRFEPFSETRQQPQGDEIESDKDLMKRMAQRAKETLKAGEEARKQAEKAVKEQAEAEKKAQEKREKIEREAAEREAARLEQERWAREGYPVRTESGSPFVIDFGFGVFFGSGHHHHHRCR